MRIARSALRGEDKNLLIKAENENFGNRKKFFFSPPKVTSSTLNTTGIKKTK